MKYLTVIICGIALAASYLAGMLFLVLCPAVPVWASAAGAVGLTLTYCGLCYDLGGCLSHEGE